jgi:D-alanine---D-serine ligase
MERKRVAVIFGGRSPEYEVSLKSSHSIISAIDQDKYEVMMLGITKGGAWYRYTGDLAGIPADTWHADSRFLKPAFISPVSGAGLLEFDGVVAPQVPFDGEAGSHRPFGGGSASHMPFHGVGVSLAPLDVAFPVLHGRYGEDGTVQGLCELAGLPVVGSGAAASALCMDKDRSHKLVSLAGIAVPKSICFEYRPPEDELIAAAHGLTLPVFVKPVKAGSSFGIAKVRDYAGLPAAVATALTFDDAVIVEEAVDGFEVGCAVVGNHELVTGRPDEIEISGEFFDYEEKYSLKTSRIYMPARVDADTENRLRETAKEIYLALGCRGYARVDMFVTKGRRIVFNEVNTIPGFTAHSRFPSMMKGVGMDFKTLVDKLISLALDEKQGAL